MNSRSATTPHDTYLPTSNAFAGPSISRNTPKGKTPHKRGGVPGCLRYHRGPQIKTPPLLLLMVAASSTTIGAVGIYDHHPPLLLLLKRADKKKRAKVLDSR